MKKTSYKEKSVEDLVKALGEKREAFRKLRFGDTGSKSRNVKESVSIRRDVARILTELKSPTKSSATKK